MEPEQVQATLTLAVPATTIFALLTDPAHHAVIDGTGWVCAPVDTAHLTTTGQIFRMGMFHPNHPDGRYEMANKILTFDPPHAISWQPGYETGDGTLAFGGWVWRYDLVAVDATHVKVTLSYDWSAVPEDVRRTGPDFPPFPPDHLTKSLAHLAELAGA